MERAQKYETEWACEQVLARLIYCLDERHYDNLVSLFEPEGVWLRLGKELRGRAEIMAAMQARSSTYVIRHLLSNFLVTSRSGAEIEAITYLTAFSDDRGIAPVKPVSIRSPSGVYLMKAQFSRSDAQVRLRHLAIDTEFSFHQ